MAENYVPTLKDVAKRYVKFEIDCVDFEIYQKTLHDRTTEFYDWLRQNNEVVEANLKAKLEVDKPRADTIQDIRKFLEWVGNLTVTHYSLDSVMDAYAKELELVELRKKVGEG